MRRPLLAADPRLWAGLDRKGGRKPGFVVPAGLIELLLGKGPRIAQVRPTEIGAAKSSPPEIGVAEIGGLKITIAEDSLLEIGADKGGLQEIRPTEIGAAEHSPTEIGIV